ncbi:carbohydrate ABC transporter permease [Pseudofrankia sp. DC12]|uniref:carbohydrate ABC transporter permease n=1 Tax=Pseudofrankia sp. DC12 TaxID=683315 RepID=UPI0005F89098|nr:carbohydrate ABC transporter permease [Pseudofrankia sp. DC12]
MSQPSATPTAARGGGRAAGFAGRSVILALGVFFALLPFVWMVRTAFGPSQSAFQLTSNPIPQSVSFDAFQRAWADGHLGRALLTGIGVSLAIVVLQLLTAVPAAYVFAWLPFRGRAAVFAVVLATLLIPSQVTAIPNYVTISALGLSNTRVGLVLPFMTSAAAIFLLRQYMTTIPVSVLEAARMDGLGPLRTLRTIVVPLSMPAIATVSVFSFLLSFNEYLWPVLEARSPEIATPPLALATMLASPKYGLPDFAELAAGALVVSLPTLVVFFIAQRRLTSGLTGTGVGG